MQLLILLLAAVFLCGCQTHSPAATEPVRRNGTGCGVVAALAQQRAAFLRDGTPEEVFAVFYWHVTRAILDEATAGRLRHPAILREMVKEFHADYDRNRCPETREPHWWPYYEKAAALQRSGLHWSGFVHPCDSIRPRGLLLLGVCAHIDGDLPRCIARVLRRHPEVPPAEVAADFQKLDAIFAPCGAAGFADLAKVLPGRPPALFTAMEVRAASLIILQKRHQVWRAAVSEVNAWNSARRLPLSSP